jgi:capsular exopolysaccharide synthesis family protein
MTEPGYPAQEQQTLDFKKLFNRILRNWYWIVISVIIGLAIAIWMNRYTNPMYSAKATLIINDERKSTAELLINALDRFNARKNVENEIAILKSYRLAYRTISELDYSIFYYKKGNIRQSLIYKNVPFKVVLDTAGNNVQGVPVGITLISDKQYEVSLNNKQQKLNYGQYFRNDKYNFTVLLDHPELFAFREDESYMFIVNDINKLATQYSSKLNISTNDKKGTVLILQTIGADAQMESDYLNKLMEVYIRSGLEEKNQAAINTINFIDEQLATVIDSLNMVESKMQDFKAKSKMMAVSEEGKYLFTKVDDLQKERATMEVELRYYEYLDNYLEGKNDFSTVIAPTSIGITESPIATGLGQLIELYKQRKSLLMTATSNNPAIAAIDQNIQSLLDALRESLTETVKLTNNNLKEIDYRMQSIEAEMAQLPSTERKLLNIQRSYKLNDQIYNFLLQRRADAAIARASNVADNKILDISRTENSTMVSPKKPRNMMIGIILGGLIPIGILFLIEFFNPIITDPNDIKKMSKVPVVGSIGHNDRDSELPVVSNPQSVIAEAFRALRTNLQYYLREKGQKVICVSSTVSGEGKTFTAVNLASIIAQAGKKTLLVSLDLRKPKIHQVFNFENKVGLSNYLIEKAKYEDIVVPTNVKNLFITMAGPIPPNPAELIETARMEEFMEHAKNEFDIIILDTPPLAIVTDAMLLVRHANATLFVVRANYSSTDVLKLVEELREKEDIVNLGIVVNDIKFSKYLYGNKYGYKYGYSYGHGYGKGQGYYGEEEVRTKWWQRVFKA